MVSRHLSRDAYIKTKQNQLKILTDSNWAAPPATPQENAPTSATANCYRASASEGPLSLHFTASWQIHWPDDFFGKHFCSSYLVAESMLMCNFEQVSEIYVEVVRFITFKKGLLVFRSFI